MRCAALLWGEDACSRGLGMVIVEVAPGRAVIEMTIDARMVNGHGIAHPGMIATLAESALSFGANSRNRRSFVQQVATVYLAPVQQGERLRAEAVERSASGRLAVFDVTVVNDAGNAVAELRGTTRETGESVLGEAAPRRD